MISDPLTSRLRHGRGSGCVGASTSLFGTPTTPLSRAAAPQPAGTRGAGATPPAPVPRLGRFPASGGGPRGQAPARGVRRRPAGSGRGRRDQGAEAFVQLSGRGPGRGGG